MPAILGLFPAAFMIFALNWIVDTVAGLSLIDYSSGRPTPDGVVLILLVWLSVSFGLWWVDMYGLIRGWWTDGSTN